MVDISNIKVVGNSIYATMDAKSDKCISDVVIDIKTGNIIALNNGIISYDMLKARWVLINNYKDKNKLPSEFYINWGM